MFKNTTQKGKKTELFLYLLTTRHSFWGDLKRAGYFFFFLRFKYSLIVTKATHRLLEKQGRKNASPTKGIPARQWNRKPQTKRSNMASVGEKKNRAGNKDDVFSPSFPPPPFSLTL